jgi:hypothetical protein
MTLFEAFVSCRNGDFVSHQNFDSSQSMHEYKYSLYYEDGANLDNHIDWLEGEKWAKDGWFVKYPRWKIDTEKLNKIHKDNGGFMLQSGSYEDCIIE